VLLLLLRKRETHNPLLAGVAWCGAAHRIIINNKNNNGTSLSSSNV
jgi:hypothetical protein